ncbi:MAG: hypothetical protein EOS73_25485 [Mesorhizobium sp.]|uniref:head-tail connector protein n=1 Tax=Mesorhizobium sp. M7A.F.Ca.ET.027.02.1.1 TaxID=2496655 RepID=UPI000FD19CBE|nr:head-tail connector protein [Mesorhizobium sp. M7A.F.Ca.ET.027.02.1.1]RVD13553.1 hypothetical protein EN749_23045 [Mesorhizobium sp. M7A.F.Ca.ET.027.02.1.1]RWD00507.1 MAG: hypothetical protein EOS73_25485 [Mesorhizobium sp.]
MLAPVRTIAPESTAVSVDDVKLYCKTDSDIEDLMLTGLINATTSHMEMVLGMALVTQTWRQDFGRFGCLRLPKRPVAATGLVVAYRDVENVEQTLSDSIYQLLVDEAGPYLALAPDQQWPEIYSRVDAVSVTFVAGVAAAAVEPALKTALLLHIAHLYENREAVNVGNIVTMLPLGYEAIIWPFKKPGV